MDTKVEEKKERRRQSWRKWYSTHKEESRIRSRDYYFSHLEECRARGREYARAHYAKKQRQAVWGNYKRCRKCKAEGIPLMKASKTNGRQYYICRPCNRERARKYVATEKGKRIVYACIRRSEAKLRSHRHARATALYWQKTGRLVKPERCESCGKKEFLYKHHPDYNQPTKVDWLCRDCHCDAEKKKRELTAQLA